MPYQFSEYSRARLVGVHPDLVRVAELALALSPHDFRVTEGMRTPERQAFLKLQGFSRTLHSKHLAQPDGYAHAIDVMAVGDLNGDGRFDHKDTSLTWDKDIYLEIAAAFDEAAKKVGVEIRWGGDFDGFFDGPHFELVI